MPQRIIDVLESVQIQKQHRDSGIVAARCRNCLGEAILQQGPVGQIRENIVVCHMGHFRSPGPPDRHVVEDNNSSRRQTMLVMDRSSRVFNSKFSSVTSYQNAVRRKSNSSVFPDCRSQWIRTRLPRAAVDDYKYLIDILACGCFSSPTGDLFRYDIKVGNSPFKVRAQYGVPYGIERYLGAFFLRE